MLSVIINLVQLAQNQIVYRKLLNYSSTYWLIWAFFVVWKGRRVIKITYKGGEDKGID